MFGIIRQNVKTVIISGTVAACTAAVMAGAPALAGSLRAAATSPSPQIISGSKAIDFLPSSPTVATMSLPAGTWVIFAKADLAVFTSSLQMHCKLAAGNSSDRTDPQMTSTSNDVLSLKVTHTFRRAGTVKLTCNSSGFTADLFNIGITAIKAGKLTNVSLH